MANFSSPVAASWRAVQSALQLTERDDIYDTVEEWQQLFGTGTGVARKQRQQRGASEKARPKKEQLVSANAVQCLYFRQAAREAVVEPINVIVLVALTVGCQPPFDAAAI